jgi:hypothetical protein
MTVGRCESPILHPGVDSCAVANTGGVATYRQAEGWRRRASPPIPQTDRDGRAPDHPAGDEGGQDRPRPFGRGSPGEHRW